LVKIVTDTACNLPAAWLEEYQITRIPFNIQFGLETFREGIDLTSETFYRRIQTEARLPTTSQPAVGEFIKAYETLGNEGESELLSIQLTSQLSGAWQAARLAADRVSDRIKVHVIDSLTGSVGLGLMVREAAQLVQNGLGPAEIVPHLEARRGQIKVFIMLKDLRYARMSGRVGALRETLASLLNVKPIIGVQAGDLVPLDRVRGSKKGFERMLTLAQELTGDAPVHVGMTHALAPTEADRLLAQIKTRLNCRDTFVTELALSLAVHFGPGTVGFATYPAE
jgi:DegV family protein with EDD domain